MDKDVPPLNLAQLLLGSDSAGGAMRADRLTQSRRGIGGKKKTLGAKILYMAGEQVMTPEGPGIVKYVFSGGISRVRTASYAVMLSPNRPGIVYSERELRPASPSEAPAPPSKTFTQSEVFNG